MEKEEMSALLRILKRNGWKEIKFSKETMKEIYEGLGGDYRYKNGINC